MLRKIILSIFITLFFALSAAKCQIPDSSKQLQKSFQTDSTNISKDNFRDDDFSPGLLFFALVAVILVFVCIGMGVAVVVIGLLIVFAFVSLGLLSTSVIIGLNKKSFTAGFKTFLTLSISLCGLGIGIGILYLFNKIFQLHFTNISIMSIGAIGGLLSGILLAQLVYIIIKRLTIYFKQRLNLA